MGEAYNIESQAVLNLLSIDDNFTLENSFFNPELAKQPIINKSKATKSFKFSSTINFSKPKIKTQPASIITNHLSKNSTFNKQNLKKILTKLENMPSPEQVKSKKQNCFTHLKATEWQGQNSFPKKSVQLQSFHKTLKIESSLNTLVKKKIAQKIKWLQIQKKSSIMQNFLQKKDKTRRSGSHKKKSNINNLLKEEERLNGCIFSGKNSRITLRNLLF